MTVSTSTNSVVYRGNGATTAFAVPFKVLDEDHLQVKRRLFATGVLDYTYVGTDYSYSGIGADSGTLTLAGTALDDDYELVIERIVPYTQDLDIVNAGGFYPETVEEQLDLIVMGVQQLADRAERSITVPVGETVSELPNGDERANKFIAFDADGGIILSSGTGADAGLRGDLADEGAFLMGIAPYYVTHVAETAQQRFDSEPLSFYRYLRTDWRAAFEDGTTDKDIIGTALQDAVTDACEKNRALILPDGKYLGFTRQTNPSGKKALLFIPSGASLTMRGNGRNTRLTVPDDFTLDGDYNFIHDYDAETTPLGNIEISGIHIDGNGPNNCVIDSVGANIRGAYPIKLRKGLFLYIGSSYFTDNPGRNIILAANPTVGTPDWGTVLIDNSHVRNVAGAIEGNEGQNDHSSFYMQADVGIVNNCTFSNDNPDFDPLSVPTRAVNAIENHSRRANNRNFVVSNYGSGGIAAAQVMDVEYSIWENFMIKGRSNLFSPFISAGRRMGLLRLNNGVFEIDNSVGSGGTGFLQGTGSSIEEEIDRIELDTLAFIGDTKTPMAVTTHGAQVTAAKQLSAKRLYFDSIQGNGLLLTDHSDGLGIHSFEIDEITARNTGIHTAGTQVFAVRVVNADAGDDVIFENGTIGPNIKIIKEAQPVGTAPLNCRGISVSGPGHLQNFEVHMPRTRNINRVQRCVISTPTKNRNVRVRHRVVTLGKAETPVSGFFDIGSTTTPGERIVHSDPAAGYASERIVATGGSASEAVWATATAYLPGQWIRTSIGKTLECLVAGTSHAATEPNPTTLGETFTDGTVTWMYKDSAAAAFIKSNWTPLVVSSAVDLPSIAAGALGSEVTVAVTGAVAGARVNITPSGGGLSGIQLGDIYTTTDNVKFTPANPTSGAIDASSRTLIIEVYNP